MIRRSIKTKIILVTVLCVLLVGIASNTFLYRYLSDIILEKSNYNTEMNLEYVRRQLDNRIRSFETLGTLCASDHTIASAMRHEKMATPYQKKAFIEAHSILTQYYNGSGLSLYIDKLIAFNDSGQTIRISGQQPNLQRDPLQIIEQPFFKEYATVTHKHHLLFTDTVSSDKKALIYFAPIYELDTKKHQGWIYMEINDKWINDIFDNYEDGQFFLWQEGALYPPEAYPYSNETMREMVISPEGYSYEEEMITISLAPLRVEGVRLGQLTDISFIEKDGRPALFTVIVVIITSIIVALLLAIVLSNFITRPINKLIHRISQISENDFSYDPSIEQGDDEIALVGHMVNEMSGSIQHLLEETEKMYEQQKDSEIALLQSQINPHFLYNTLDSIHWMATIQKNTGIVNMTRSLSNLLKNIAKGVGDIIPIQEELHLLEDYVTIQSIRYMENFQVIYNIPDEHMEYGIIKLTLQPLVENAIYHGIEPTGTYGTVIITSHEQGDDLLLMVEDDGVGMTTEEIRTILEGDLEGHSSGFSGMGVKNVHERLQLMYGKEYGLFYESEEGEYTRVTVRIPKTNEY